jgi:hypothetical protein
MPVSYDGGQRRNAKRPGLVATRHDLRHRRRPDAAPLQPRRAAATDQRPRRRHVSGGPKAGAPEFIAQFRKDVSVHAKNLVKAGITGWAQVNDLRASSDLAKRIQYDLYYIDNWSLWFDLRILALTIMHIFRSRNAY